MVQGGQVVVRGLRLAALYQQVFRNCDILGVVLQDPCEVSWLTHRDDLLKGNNIGKDRSYIISHDTIGGSSFIRPDPGDTIGKVHTKLYHSPGNSNSVVGGDLRVLPPINIGAVDLPPVQGVVDLAELVDGHVGADLLAQHGESVGDLVLLAQRVSRQEV